MLDARGAIIDTMGSSLWWSRHVRRRMLRCIPLLLGLLAIGCFGAPRAHAQTQLPCDIYGSTGTPCVAAHSTVRALYASYGGPLYQVTRGSDGTATDIGLLSVGGYANAAAQDHFCANTTCTITEIYDQSGKGNNLRIEGPGQQGLQPNPRVDGDRGAPAEALAVTAGGVPVYGVEISSTIGYRNDSATGTAVEGQPEGMYMVTSGTHANAGCCFDYGNAEVHNNDPGDGHMDTINFGTNCYTGPCYGSGPWVMADLENGLFESNTGNSQNSSYTGNTQPFVTAMLKNNGQNHFALHSADATAGGLLKIYDGPTPSNTIHGSEPSGDFGYTPMHQEGAIVLGTGGDNSNASIGSFFEGVMTSGYPSDDADARVQANIISVGYTTTSTTGTPGTLQPGSEVSLRATTACCTGDYLRHQNGGVVISAITAGSGLLDRSDATWIVRRGLADNACVSFESKNFPGDYIRHSNYQLYRQPYAGPAVDANAANDATFCPAPGNSGQGNSFESVNYPGQYIRHYNSTGYIASDGGPNAWDGTTSWDADTSWIVTTPLAN